MQGKGYLVCTAEIASGFVFIILALHSGSPCKYTHLHLRNIFIKMYCKTGRGINL